MITWILIILLRSGGTDGGVAVTTVEFNNQNSCQIAMQRTNDSHLNEISFVKSIDAYCVQK